MMDKDFGRVPAAPGSREPSRKEASRPQAASIPSRGAVVPREPTLEEATMFAVMSATNATFNWRGQEDLTPLMAVNICAGVIAYLRAMPPGYSLEELAVAIENLKLALGRDSDASYARDRETGLGPEGVAARAGTASPKGATHAPG